MKQKNGKMAFADFLDVMHTHSSKENLPKELLDAFKCYDTQKRGVIHAKDLRRILVKWGEQLSSKEGKTHHLERLKYGFSNKSFRKDEPLAS